MNAGPSFGQRLDRSHCIRRKRQVKAGPVLLHVLGVGASGHRQHPDRACEGEHDLGRGSVSARCQIRDQWVAQRFRIRGEERESLIDDLSLPAERSYIPVSAEAGEATVLDKCGSLSVDGGHLLKVPEGHVADTEETRVSGIALPDHRFPDGGVRVGPIVAGGRSVQHVAVDVIGPEMFERTGHRLSNLNR